MGGPQTALCPALDVASRCLVGGRGGGRGRGRSLPRAPAAASQAGGGDCPDFCGRTPQKWDCPLSAALARTPDVADDQADDDLADSEILFVEDLDSYSIIDLMGDVPLVSFATKDSYVPVCVVPLLPEPSS